MVVYRKVNVFHDVSLCSLVQRYPNFAKTCSFSSHCTLKEAAFSKTGYFLADYLV
jgi:hypothetical protein